MAAGTRLPPGNDPRLKIDSEELDAANIQAMPQVARASNGVGLALGVIGILGLGALTWFGLSGEKPHSRQLPPPSQQMQMPQRSMRQGPSVLPPIDPSVNPVQGPEPQSLLVQPPVQGAPVPQPAPPAVDNGTRAPAMVVDNSVPASQTAAQQQAAATAAAAAAAKPVNSNDAFVASQTANVSQKAMKIGDPSRVVPQGAVIPAVLETAINSDLPGYTRAIVSRDIRSFDGTNILIPRGSRLVGQYKSGLTSGETRAFIIWDRLIRPDGLSVQLASPATDDLGQAGASGKVNSHFAKRFGSAILLSVVNGLSTIASGKSSSTIVIGTSGDASGVIGEALSNDIKIPPTIKVPQGASIQVFAARDLDFNQ
ncbi:MAG: type IV secretion system protein VirB10 [Asticcacaulis sp.]|uniref:type IV secretion system protein VirB10 n=1 Tax=Asticcacaulis sp. TaxID=1872648 RepID=UPI0039E49674